MRLLSTSAAALGPIVLAACAAAPAQIVAAPSDPVARQTPAGARPPASNQLQAPVAESYVRGEWLQADNRATCAPIAFGTDADVGGAPRPAEFSGGWAVAFDLPGRRSAYGIAGAGVSTKSAEELRRQWPYALVPGHLPSGSFAGYGVEGAAPYTDHDPAGRNVKSLAYVRVTGQDCLYNVWSNLGRAHLETMLASLRVLPH